MEFLVLSREQAKYVDPSVNYIVISITDTTEYPAKLIDNKFCKGILRLAFHDIDREDIATKYGYNIITKEQAKQILEFVDDHINGIQLIVVHCEAGISRSSAIASALSEIYIGHDSGFFKTHIPNMLVYRTILNCNSKFNFEEMFT